MGSRGFTLIEFVMVMVLLGILAAVSIPSFYDFRDSAKESVTRDEMAAIKRSLVGDARVVAGGTQVFRGFEADMGRLPVALSELVLNPATGNTTQDYNPLTRRGWSGPYIDDATQSDYSKDAWGTPYVFTPGSRLLRSWGPNKANNAGAGDDIDLTY